VICIIGEILLATVAKAYQSSAGDKANQLNDCHIRDADKLEGNVRVDFCNCLDLSN